MRKKSGDVHMAGAPMRAEDSRWYHPTLNPTGAPPPGKAAAGLITAPPSAAAGASGSRLSVPVPKKPPLPAGPAPLPPPPSGPPGESAKAFCLVLLLSFTLLTGIMGQIRASKPPPFSCPLHSPASAPFVPPARRSPAAVQSASGHGIPGHDDGSAARNAHPAPAVGAATRPPAAATSRAAAGCTRRSRSVTNGHLCFCRFEPRVRNGRLCLPF